VPSQTKAFPYSTDFTKAFAAFQFPGFDLEKITSAYRKNFDALNAAGQLAFEGLQTAARRQFEMASELATGSNGAQDFFSVTSPTEKIAQHADLAKTAFDKGLTNLRELSEILVKSNNEAAEVLAKRVGESLTEFKTVLKTA
jgi:phasin family protein